MPVGKPFLPGHKGMGGRPRTSDIKAAVREFGEEIGNREEKTRFRMWLETAHRMARQGSPKHLELLLAYGWHRPLQAQLNVNADLPSDDEALREVEEALRELRAADEHKPTVQ